MQVITVVRAFKHVHSCDHKILVECKTGPRYVFGFCIEQVITVVPGTRFQARSLLRCRQTNSDR